MVNSACPDWRDRGIVSFRYASRAVERAAKPNATPTRELAEYDVDRNAFSGTEHAGALLIGKRSACRCMPNSN